MKNEWQKIRFTEKLDVIKTGWSEICTAFSKSRSLIQHVLRVFCSTSNSVSAVEDWVHGVGHSPVCQILLQIVMRVVITPSPPAWTSSAGMLSTPAPVDFPFFSDSLIVQQPKLLCKGWGGPPLCLSGDSSVLVDLH